VPCVDIDSVASTLALVVATLGLLLVSSTTSTRVTAPYVWNTVNERVFVLPLI
jgi:hypothetical protein